MRKNKLLGVLSLVAVPFLLAGCNIAPFLRPGNQNNDNPSSLTRPSFSDFATGVAENGSTDGTVVIDYGKVDSIRSLSYSADGGAYQNVEKSESRQVTATGSYRIDVILTDGQVFSYSFSIVPAGIPTLHFSVEAINEHQEDAACNTTVTVDWTNPAYEVVYRKPLEANGGTSFSKIESGATFGEDGFYEVDVRHKDKRNKYEFTVKKKKMSFELSNSVTKIELEDGQQKYLNARDYGNGAPWTVSYIDDKPSYFEKNIGVPTYTFTSLDGVATEAKPITDFALTEDGTYVFEGTDIVGNKTTATLYKDVSAPSIQAVQVEEVGSVENPVLDGGYVGIAAKKTVASWEGATSVSVNGVALSDAEVASGNKDFVAEGKYQIDAVDRAGNETSFHFTIDKTEPVFELTSDGKVLPTDVEAVNKDVLVKVSEENLKLFEYDIDGKWKKVSGDEALLTEEGRYELWAEDEAGNNVVVQIAVDKTKPTLAIQGKDGKDLADGGSYEAQAVNFVYSDNISKNHHIEYSYIPEGQTKGEEGLRVNSVKNYDLKAKGTYSFVAKDDAGNASSPLTIIIH